jgi:uncharacterized protein
MELVASSLDGRPSDVAGFIITHKCNLCCKYCFVKEHNSIIMTNEIAKKGVDYFFSDAYKSNYDNINFDFCGGEVFLCIDTLNYLINYIKENIEKTKKWKTFSFNIISNGTLLSEPNVREFIIKNNELLHLSISLDGNKYIQDTNRDNSFDRIMDNIDFWKQLKNGIKIKTVINHNSLPSLYEDMKFLLSLNVKKIKTSLVTENSDWEDGDDELFYNQLILLADYIIDNHINTNIALFNYSLFINTNNKKRACYAGLYGQAIFYDGDILPCGKLKSNDGINSLGNVFTGITPKKLLPLYFYENKQKLYTENNCKDCKVKSYCRDCMGLSFSETGSIFNMVSHNCKMYIANDKANKYFWNKRISAGDFA